MTDCEREILAVLLELDKTVKGMSGANPKPDLLPLFYRLDHLMAQLPSGADPNLLHYLRKKSYEKARQLLEEREAENQSGNFRVQPASK